MGILVTLLACLGSMSCALSWSSFDVGAIFSFFNSFTLSAYLRVFKVCSEQERPGETFAIIVVLQFPVKESFKTYVNLDPLNGV